MCYKLSDYAIREVDSTLCLMLHDVLPSHVPSMEHSLQLVKDGLRCSAGVPLTGENALQRYDYHGLRRIRECALNSHNSGSLHQVTFLRMGSLMIDHWDSFKALVADLGGGSAMSPEDVVV
jgi:hypothetical protein